MRPQDAETLFKQIGQDMANLFKRVTTLEKKVDEYEQARAELSD